MQNEEAKIIIPSLFKYEVLKTATILEEDLKKPFELLTHFLEAGVEVKEVNFQILEIVKKIILNGSIKSGFPSFYDAIYHAIAISEKATFITADKKYFAKVNGFNNIVLLNESLFH